MKLYIKYIKPYGKQIVLLSLINVCASMLALFFAYYSKDLIDEAMRTNMQSFVFYAIVLASLLLFNLLLQVLFKYVSQKFLNQSIKNLRSTYYSHLLHTHIIDSSKYHSGILLNHLENDIEIVANQMIYLIPRLSFYIVRLIGAFVLLLIIEPTFSIIFFTLGIILFLLSRWIAPKIKQRHKNLQIKKDHLRSHMQESLENISVIKAFQAEQSFEAKQQDLQSQANDAKMSQVKLSLVTSSGMNLFFAFGYAFALIFGGYQLQFGLSVGYLIAMIQLIQHLQSPFSNLSLLYPKYMQSLASIERLETLKDLPIEENLNLPLETFTEIEAQHISFQYANHSVINDLTFKIKAQSLVLLKGPSGIGKSTLLKLLLGFYPITSGKLLLKTETNTYDITANTRSYFTYVPQDHMILSGTIRENLNLYKTHDDQALIQALKDVSLYDELTNEDILDIQLNEKGARLSIGQIQRLAIARALLKDAPIICLDEVTSALNIQLEETLIKHLKTLKNKTIILISHHQLDDKLFDQIIHL